jgi:hypothetical protein
MIVVIPSTREINLPYLSPLIDAGARFIIVDDTEGTISVDHPSFYVYNWGHRRDILGDLDPYFPRRNGASRDFGFLMAWKQSDPGEVVIALDDDCEVYHPDFPSRVEAVLSSEARPVATCDGVHLNIIDLYRGAPADLYPRGFPYSARVGYRPATLKAPEARPVAFCLGLWKNVFDINAIDKIQGPAYEHPDIELEYPSVIVESGKLVSVCSMNMHFRRELIPAVYQLPMHVGVMPGWVIDRYGDIWGGFVLKALMDLKGDAMAVGEPMIRHLKQGNYLRNAWQEHICHLVNDEFLEVLSDSTAEIAAASYLDMMRALSQEFGRRAHSCSPLLAAYASYLHRSMEAWVCALGDE